MKIMKYLALLMLMLSFLACSKHQLPVPPNGNGPMFYFTGIMGNDSVTWQAGQSDFYMHTSYFKDVDDLMVLKGVLGPKNCPECSPAISIEFRDIAPTLDSILKMNFNIHFNNRDFFSFVDDTGMHSQNVEIFHFAPLSLQPIASAFWQFDDGTTSNQINPSHVFNGGGLRNVKLVVQQNGLIDSLVIPIDASYNSSNRVQFTWNQDTNNAVSAQISSGNFQSYSWQSGNGLSFQGPNASFFYNNPGVYTLSCRGINNQKEAWYKAKIKVPNYGPWANPNFTYTTELVNDTLMQQPINAGSVLIRVKKEGKEYRSYKNGPAGNLQAPVKIMRVFNYAPFELNEQGKSTISIEFSIDAWLFNAQNPNDSMLVRSNASRMALAYPK